MARSITIDPVTRIEGHAKVTIHLDDAARVANALLNVNEFRGFEKFCEGRPFFEMPGITARICGICPVSHLLASAKAGDAILGVEIPARRPKLRRLMNLGQFIQSHALSFFHLSSPDLLLGFDSDPAKRNVMGLIAAEPELARERRPAAQVRPGDHRAARRQADPPGLGGAGRRARPARPRRIATRIKAGIPEALAHALGARSTSSSGCSTSIRDEAAPSATSRACSWAWSAPTAPGRTTTASCASWTQTGAIVADQVDPARYDEIHRRGRRALVVPEVPVLPAAGYPDGHVPRRPAGPAERLQPTSARRWPTQELASSDARPRRRSMARSSTTTPG